MGTRFTNIALVASIAVSGAALSVPAPTSPGFVPASVAAVNGPVEVVEREPREIVDELLTNLDASSLDVVISDLSGTDFYGTGPGVAGAYFAGTPGTIWLDENYIAVAPPEFVGALTLHETVHAVTYAEPFMKDSPFFEEVVDQVLAPTYRHLSPEQKALELTAACVENAIFRVPSAYLTGSCPTGFVQEIVDRLDEEWGHDGYKNLLADMTPTRQVLIRG